MTQQGTAAGELAGQQGDQAVEGQPPEWTEGWSPEQIGKVEAKGWKSPQDLMNSYENLEGMQGVPPERLLRIPEGDEVNDEWNQFFTKLGRPASQEDYDLGDMELPEGSIDLRPMFGEWAHSIGLNQTQARKLADTYNGFMVQTVEQMEQEQIEQQNAELAELRKEWGAAYEEKKQAGVEGARALGVDQKLMEAMELVMGTKRMMQHFAKIGELLKEHPAPPRDLGGGQQDQDPFVMTPERAAHEIAEMRANKETMDRLFNGDQAINERFDRLFKLAFPQS